MIELISATNAVPAIATSEEAEANAAQYHINTKACHSHCEIVGINVWGETVRKILPISLGEFTRSLTEYRSGALMQDAFPSLDASDREFLISGTDWDETEEEDEMV